MCSSDLAETIDQPDDGTRQTYRIATGDTLTGALMLLGVDRKPAYAVAEALGRQTNLRRLRVGQELILVIDPGTATRKGGLAAVSLKLKPGSACPQFDEPLSLYPPDAGGGRR